MGSRTRILAAGRRLCSPCWAKMRPRLLAALVVLLAVVVSGEKMTWRNDEGNTCAIYYRFKRAMCDCGDQWGTNGKFNDQVEECVLAQLGNPDTWGYALRTKWSMRDVISLDALCAD